MRSAAIKGKKKKTIALSDVKILWGRSGDRCVLCKTELSETNKKGEIYTVGEMAHISGERSGSARFDPTMDDEKRSRYENLILVCPTHHTIIDNDESTYTVEHLLALKSEHEDWVQNTLRNHIPDVTFAELQIIINFLIGAPSSTQNAKNTISIPPKEKILKNDLSPNIEYLITIGMSQVRLIGQFLSEHEDIGFSERLKDGFVKKYKKIRASGLRGDALFYELLDFSSNNSSRFEIKAAGLSVLVYFFELCEVFEK